MTGWDKIVLDYNETGVLGKCPECGALALEVQEHISEIRDSLTVRCKKCGRGEHYDGCTKQKKC